MADGGSLLVLAPGYVSGSLLNSTSTWNNQTFYNLGLTIGSYTWTLNGGSSTDSIKMNIGASSVPEPSGLVLLGMGAVAVMCQVRRRRSGSPIPSFHDRAEAKPLD